MTPLLDRATITARLTDLAEELAVRDTRAELYVVGGAALALAYDTRRATRDIDAVFEPKAVVYEAATAVASRRGLPDGWLNDAVKGLVPAGDETAVPVLDLPSLKVSAASPRYLLAMKVAAARVDRDQADIVSLAALCGAATADEVLGIVVDVWGTTAILTPKSQFLVEELFP